MDRRFEVELFFVFFRFKVLLKGYMDMLFWEDGIYLELKEMVIVDGVIFGFGFI